MAVPHVMTVLGPVAPSDLGQVLMHEHLLCDLTAVSRRNSGEPEVEITLENAFDVNYRPGEYFGNHRLSDQKLATKETALFRAAGGGTIVEMTTAGIVPDLDGLARISRSTGVHVIASAGFYTEAYQSEKTLGLSVEALTKAIIEEISSGARGTNIRCGIIGEIGCSWPITDRKSVV